MADTSKRKGSRLRKGRVAEIFHPDSDDKHMSESLIHYNTRTINPNALDYYCTNLKQSEMATAACSRCSRPVSEKD